MIEIKPCPFCGGEAYYSHNKGLTWTVKCFRCGAEVSHTLIRLSTNENTMKEARDAAIRCWNKGVGDADAN